MTSIPPPDGSRQPRSNPTVLADTQLRETTDTPGERIGPYKLIEKRGEGGMGSVFLAEQEQPVRRRVAIKVIRPGMDSAQIVARFEAERQAVAMMDHLNIANSTQARPAPAYPTSRWNSFPASRLHSIETTTG